MISLFVGSLLKTFTLDLFFMANAQLVGDRVINDSGISFVLIVREFRIEKIFLGKINYQNQI